MELEEMDCPGLVTNLSAKHLAGSQWVGRQQDILSRSPLANLNFPFDISALRHLMKGGSVARKLHLAELPESVTRHFEIAEEVFFILRLRGS
jgi:hypothetical protein